MLLHNLKKFDPPLTQGAPELGAYPASRRCTLPAKDFVKLQTLECRIQELCDAEVLEVVDRLDCLDCYLESVVENADAHHLVPLDSARGGRDC